MSIKVVGFFGAAAAPGGAPSVHGAGHVSDTDPIPLAMAPDPAADPPHAGSAGLMSADDKGALASHGDEHVDPAGANFIPLALAPLYDGAELVDEGAPGLMSAADRAHLDRLGSAAERDAGEFAAAAPAMSQITITAGAITTPLDGSHGVLQLAEDVAAGWAAPLPSGGDASARVYWASLDILPPESGGPFALSIPATWLCLGPLDTIALAVGDDPVAVTLRSWGASGVAYSAIQSSLPA